MVYSPKTKVRRRCCVLCFPAPYPDHINNTLFVSSSLENLAMLNMHSFKDLRPSLESANKCQYSIYVTIEKILGFLKQKEFRNFL